MSGLGRERHRRPGAQHLHPRPVGGACWSTARAGTAGSSPRRRRRVASTYPASAAPKQGKPVRIGCSVIASGAPDRHQRRVLQPGCGAVHDHGVLRRRDLTLVEHQPGRLHVPDVPEPDDVLDRAQPVELPLGERRGLRHRGRHGPVDAQHHPGVLQAEEQVVRRCRLGRRLHGVRRHPDEDSRVRLDHRAVEHPRVAGPHPADRAGVDPVVEQPDARIGRGLARTDDHVLRRRLTQLDQVVDGHHVHAVGHAERRRGALPGSRVRGSGRRRPGAWPRTSYRLPGQARHEPGRRRGSRSSGRRTPSRSASIRSRSTRS